MTALKEENDEAESTEAITLGFVESEIYDISQSLGKDTFEIFQNGFLVTSTNDSGGGSLRQAIENANDDAENDTITFSDGSDGFLNFSDGASRTIFLTEQLVITNPTTILGPGMDALGISGNSNGDFIKDPGECRITFLDRVGSVYPRPVFLFGLTFKDGVAGFDKDPSDPEYNPPFGTRGDEGGLVHGGNSSSFSLLIQECRYLHGRCFRWTSTSASL